MNHEGMMVRMSHASIRNLVLNLVLPWYEHPGIHTSREVRAVLQLSVVLEYLLHLVAYPGVQRHMNVFRFVIDNIRTPRR